MSEGGVGYKGENEEGHDSPFDYIGGPKQYIFNTFIHRNKFIQADIRVAEKEISQRKKRKRISNYSYGARDQCRAICWKRTNQEEKRKGCENDCRSIFIPLTSS